MAIEPVSYASDRGPGNAWLRLAEPVADDARVVVRRLDTPSKTYLGPAGWQDQRFSFAASGNRGLRGATELLLGPQICNLVDPDVEVEIEIEDGSTEEMLVTPAFLWPAIRRSGRVADGASILKTAEKPAARIRTPRKHPPETPPPPPPEDGSSADGEPRKPELELPPVPSEEPERRNRWLPFLIVLAVVGAIALFLFWLFTSESYFRRYLHDPWCTNVGWFCAVPEVIPPNPWDLPVHLSRGPDDWQRVIANPEAPPDFLLALGSALVARAGDREAIDIGYKAIETAARDRHHAAALEWLARTSDPSLPDSEAVAGITRRATTALGFYGEATAQRLESGVAGRRHLCRWLKDREFTGSEEDRQALASDCQEH